MTPHDGSRIGRHCPIRPIVIGLAVILVVAASARPAAAAQSRADDRAWYVRFVDGIAGMLYGFAWPTATYERVTLDDISPLDRGADVVFRLHGKSAFADGDLWVQVRLQIRSGEVSGLQWGQYNGFFPPGFTSSVMIAALNEALKSANAPKPAPPAPGTVPAVVAVACFNNPTTATLSYRLQRGQRSQTFTLEPGKALINWADLSDRRFVATFDDSLADGFTGRSLEFSAPTRTGEPSTCEEDITFDFIVSDRRIGLFPRRWLAGFPHPFNAGLVSSPAKDTWRCAAGFRVYPWPTSGALDCVGNDEGVVGLGLVREDGSPFLKVSFVAVGSPAARAGIAVGQLVVSIDAASTDGMDVSAALTKIRGRISSQLRVGIASPGIAPTVLVLMRQ